MPVIPLVDVVAQHRTVAGAVREGLERLFAHGGFILGPEVQEFEQAFARFSGVRHCVGVSNGTDAIEALLRAAGVGPGDEVLLPTTTFVATAYAILRAGAVPVFADVDPETLLLDANGLEAKATPKTRAVIAVHLYGQMAPVEDLERICGRRGWILFEDAAQAHGARRHARPAGSFGAGAAISFYPGKNLGAYGDAGAVLTDREDIAEKVRALRNQGSREKHVHAEMGLNARLDTLQAIVLHAKLPHLAEWNEARARAASRYEALFTGIEEIRLPVTAAGNQHAWHLYVVRVPERDRLHAGLNEVGIGAGIHYPTPVHLQESMRPLGHRRGDLPVAEAAAAEVLSLPLFPEITEEQQQVVARRLIEAVRRK